MIFLADNTEFKLNTEDSYIDLLERVPAEDCGPLRDIINKEGGCSSGRQEPGWLKRDFILHSGLEHLEEVRCAHHVELLLCNASGLHFKGS